MKVIFNIVLYFKSTLLILNNIDLIGPLQVKTQNINTEKRCMKQDARGRI